MRVSVCLGAILIPEYPDFDSSYSAPRSRIAGIYSEIYSYSGISQTNVPLGFVIFVTVQWIRSGFDWKQKKSNFVSTWISIKFQVLMIIRQRSWTLVSYLWRCKSIMQSMWAGDLKNSSVRCRHCDKELRLSEWIDVWVNEMKKNTVVQSLILTSNQLERIQL